MAEKRLYFVTHGSNRRLIEAANRHDALEFVMLDLDVYVKAATSGEIAHHLRKGGQIEDPAARPIERPIIDASKGAPIHDAVLGQMADEARADRAEKVVEDRDALQHGHAEDIVAEGPGKVARRRGQSRVGTAGE